MSKQQMTLSQLKQFIEHTKTKKVVFASVNNEFSLPISCGYAMTSKELEILPQNNTIRLVFNEGYFTIGDITNVLIYPLCDSFGCCIDLQCNDIFEKSITYTLLCKDTKYQR